MRAENAARREDNRMAEMDHRIEMAKVMLTQNMPKDPRVEEFKKRRVEIAMQPRWWKPSAETVLPKKRHK
jgi:ribosomal protein L24